MTSYKKEELPEEYVKMMKRIWRSNRMGITEDMLYKIEQVEVGYKRGVKRLQQEFL